MPEDAPRFPVLSRRVFNAGAISLTASLAARALGSHQPTIQPTTQPTGQPTGQPTTQTRADLNDADFLEDQARRVVASALIRAGETRGPYTNSTAFDLHVPGGNMGYPAFWIRDAAMMLGADLISAAEIKGWITLIARTIRDTDWNVREGVVVPAYLVPDHINFDGSACFYPGSYESGDKQGGPPWGKFPPLDDNFYFIDMVYQHWRLTRDIKHFFAPVHTATGQWPLSAVCIDAYGAVPCEAMFKLVTAGNIDTDNAKDWGFCDSVFKSGALLFPSILKWQAAAQLAVMFAALGDKELAARFSGERDLLAIGLITFLYPSGDNAIDAQPNEAWLHSAERVGNQPDIWGSALAAASGAITGRRAERVSRALVRAYREKTAVRDGLVRHILTTDTTNNSGWQKSVSPVGEYQNGGYWSAPSGWYIAAMNLTDPAAARDMARDFVRTLRSWLRDDGTTRAWEWSNPDTGRQANEFYAASVALPWITLKNANLLHLLRDS
ncbi:MAG: PT domain-containing protein [Phycisphaerales bacterium]|jgi:hypothetical protein|nr:PT domain-containing protein [Phycisphaerales bacterium]